MPKQFFPKSRIYIHTPFRRPCRYGTQSHTTPCGSYTTRETLERTTNFMLPTSSNKYTSSPQCQPIQHLASLPCDTISFHTRGQQETNSIPSQTTEVICNFIWNGFVGGGNGLSWPELSMAQSGSTRLDVKRSGLICTGLAWLSLIVVIAGVACCSDIQCFRLTPFFAVGGDLVFCVFVGFVTVTTLL